ncbi:MAG: hypothetical protein BGO77_00050 [Caedibacter sp. 37-49]|nr:MAG: hypothetical protein BGO77_00050 [Caedibacter sp. 37-49]
MNFRSFYSFLISFFLLVTVCCASVTEQETKAILKVHSVGQGNCVSLEIKDTQGHSEFMLVDIGSSAFAKEAIYTRAQSKVVPKSPEKSPETAIDKAKEVTVGTLVAANVPKFLDGPSTPVKDKTEASLVIPDSVIKKPDWSKTQINNQDVTPRNTVIEDFITEMRIMLELKRVPKGKELNPTIYVKTVVITHPDRDHYNWLTKLFRHEEDKIDFLIFGGLPSHYYEDSDDRAQFNTWLTQRILNDCKVFFPAVQYDPVKPLDMADPLKEVLEKEMKEEFSPHTFFDDPTFSSLPFAQAFNFGKNVIISPLSINPLHFGNIGEVIRSSNDKKDDNRDSIVLKIQCGEFSAMLMGDATQATERRIKGNYKENLAFLKSSFLLASHHGSAEEGCNSEKWIELVAPQYVVISNGWNKKYGHPRERAYENFKKSSKLKSLPTAHQILVGRGEDKFDEYYNGGLHVTHRAIFSTLNSGTITVSLEPKRIRLDCRNQPSEALATEESVTEVEVVEGNTEVVMSPLKEEGLSKSEKFPDADSNPSLEEANIEEKEQDGLSTSLVKRRGEAKDLAEDAPKSKRNKKKEKTVSVAASSKPSKK